jgi:hypothetical protein
MISFRLSPGLEGSATYKFPCDVALAIGLPCLAIIFSAVEFPNYCAAPPSDDIAAIPPASKNDPPALFNTPFTESSIPIVVVSLLLFIILNYNE